MQKRFYITTTAPYVNADPHIGYALEMVQADALARFKKQQGFDVKFGYGTDEHGVKIYRKAVEAKMDPKTYCDQYAKKFRSLPDLLSVETTHFIRTTDPDHIHAAQEFWKRCALNDDIYKKNYAVKYCVGCELEKTDSELVDGVCPVHPHMKIESYEEENYFFRFSRYKDMLLQLYKENPEFIVPENRMREMRIFVEKGLQDFSISRLKSKMPWGIDVPGDPSHVMYVWFDALVFYLSNLGWPKQNDALMFWPGVQVAGKDNLRQQSAIWQAMLFSAKLPTSKQIRIHGFITSQGQKMSKSLGNVINPFEIVKQFGSDAVRYYLLREIPSYDDGDFSFSRMKELYNADLANELGNMISRILTLAEKDGFMMKNAKKTLFPEFDFYEELCEKGEFVLVLENIWNIIKRLNKDINEFAPWNKKPDQRYAFLDQTLSLIREIGNKLYPFLPTTSKTILKATQGKIVKIPPLFPRI